MEQETRLQNIPRQTQNILMAGRLHMADWIEMSEPDFANEIRILEKDPLFQKLYFGTSTDPRVISRQRWRHAGFSNSFYDINEQSETQGAWVDVEGLLEEKANLIDFIKKMGQEAFERHFIFGDEAVTLAEIAAQTGLKEEEVLEINKLLLDVGVQTEFSTRGAAPGAKPRTCIAEVWMEQDEPRFAFLSPHWARGIYLIRYDMLEEWKQHSLFAPQELRRLPRLLRKMETINLRQNTLFRIFETLVAVQGQYLRSRREEHKAPISLRKLAARLQLAPSTVSRALSGRSIRMPWGEEIASIELAPGQRRVVSAIVSRWLDAAPDALSRQVPRERSTRRVIAPGTAREEVLLTRGTTLCAARSFNDRALAQRLKAERGIAVSRRTVNSVRHELACSRLRQG